jgi:hypothetical protein
VDFVDEGADGEAERPGCLEKSKDWEAMVENETPTWFGETALDGGAESAEGGIII